MRKSTEQIFDAPWKKSFHDWESYKEITIYDSKNQPVCLTRNKEMSNRLARLPELYDALMYAVKDKCSNCGFSVATNPVDFCKDCKYKEFFELLEDVRKGK